VIVVGLDPGTEKSSVVHFNGESITLHTELPNDQMLASLRLHEHRVDVLAIEQIESFGMAVGKEVFQTVFWAGRFAEAWSPDRFAMVTRREVKQHLCSSARATDSNIRQALIDRFGPGLDKAVGKKKTPGPLYGIKQHCWSALAVAITWFDLHAHEGTRV
jgi:hypothetical protein